MALSYQPEYFQNFFKYFEILKSLLGLDLSFEFDKVIHQK
nr:MAG TPA: hypothetical protein [Caudoviricetes sp.]